MSNVTATTLHLTWNDNANNEDHYLIQRHIPGGQYNVVATLPPNTTSFDDSGLTPGTEYDYHVLASNVAGNTDFSGVLTATLTDAPTNLTATTGTNPITLNWTPPDYEGDDSALVFSVFRGTSPGGEGATAIATNLTDPTYTDPTVTAGVTYYYTVTAIDPGGSSPISNEAVGVAGETAHVFHIMLDSTGANLDYWADVPNWTSSSSPTAVYPINSNFTLNISGGPFDDQLIYDLANGSFPASSNVTFNGGSAGNDSIVIEMAASGGSVSYGGSQVTVTAPAGGPISYQNVESIQINGGNGNDSVTQTTQPSAAVIFNGGSGNDTFNINGGAYTFTSDPSLTTSNLTVVANASVIFTGSAAGINAFNLATLTVGPTGTVTVTAAVDRANRSVLALNALNMLGGRLDLTSNDLILHNASVQPTYNAIASAYDSGRWDGAGITSTTAAGDTSKLFTLGMSQNVGQNGLVLYSTDANNPNGSFDHQDTVTSDVLVKFTYYGDADLSGKIDGVDYNQIDNGYHQGLSGWNNGDFNYDSFIDGSDYSLIDNAFNTQGSALPNAVPAAMLAKVVTAMSAVNTQLVKPTAMARAAQVVANNNNDPRPSGNSLASSIFSDTAIDDAKRKHHASATTR